jgi:hypothetical protein
VSDQGEDVSRGMWLPGGGGGGGAGECLRFGGVEWKGEVSLSLLRLRLLLLLLKVLKGEMIGVEARAVRKMKGLRGGRGVVPA